MHSVLYLNLLELYGTPRRRLPDELTWLILEIAGLVGKGDKSAFYWIYV